MPRCCGFFRVFLMFCGRRRLPFYCETVQFIVQRVVRTTNPQQIEISGVWAEVDTVGCRVAGFTWPD